MEHNALHTEETSSMPRRLLVLNELIETALDPTLAHVVFFGMRNFIDDTNYLYDVIFHVKADVADPFCSVNPKRLIVPVIRGSEEEVVSTIHSMHKKHPAFTRYAAVGDPLTFWEVEQHSLGVEMQQRRYYTVEEQRLWDHQETPKMEKHVKFMRRAIERRFRPSRCASAPATAVATEPLVKLNAS